MVSTQSIFHRLGIWLLLTAFALPAVAKTLSVQAERQVVEMGDVISLTLVADFQSHQGYLNLDSLKDQFEVLGTQRSNNIQIVNGDFQSSTRWLIQLLPKQPGELMIPPFKVDGVESRPYRLTVLPMQSSMQSGAVKPFFMEAQVSRQDPYVQSQVLYTLRFYYRGRYQSGNIRPPAFGSALTQLLVDGQAYNKRIQGHDYTVHEWVYAIYPQSSGELTVSPPLFDGRIRFNGHLKQVNLRAEPITLKVRPEATEFRRQSNNSWLPAESVQLEQQWQAPASGSLHVGDTLTQSVTLRVSGLKANQLPDLKLTTDPSFKVYPDQPQTQEQPNATGIVSQKTLKRAIIPTRSGTLTLPEQTLYWWNTQTDKLEKVTLAKKTMTVLPATSNAPQNDSSMSAHDLKTAPNRVDASAAEPFPYWPMISALLGIMWLLATVLWLRARYQLKIRPQTIESSPQTLSTSTQRPAVDSDALCRLEKSELYPALKKWLQTQWHIQHLDQLTHADLKLAIRNLEAALYSNRTFSEKDFETLCTAIKAFEKKQSEPRSKKQTGSLKPLYGER